MRQRSVSHATGVDDVSCLRTTLPLNLLTHTHHPVFSRTSLVILRLRFLQFLMTPVPYQPETSGNQPPAHRRKSLLCAARIHSPKSRRFFEQHIVLLIFALLDLALTLRAGFCPRIICSSAAAACRFRAQYPACYHREQHLCCPSCPRFD